MACEVRPAVDEDFPEIAEIAAEAFWREVGDRAKAEEFFRKRVVPRRYSVKSPSLQKGIASTISPEDISLISLLIKAAS